MAEGVDQNVHGGFSNYITPLSTGARPALLSPERFVYWLQGFLEVSRVETINAEQTKTIKEHLDMCFEHVVEPLGFVPPLDGNSRICGQVIC